mmetsp:Transcript_51920/g.118386  ORF Transcript_51920/g.118386 Transcript_51920/m.118386 type:complete len:269 (-) Transcript_51920:1902-2708(-)
MVASSADTLASASTASCRGGSEVSRSVTTSPGATVRPTAGATVSPAPNALASAAPSATTSAAPGAAASAAPGAAASSAPGAVALAAPGTTLSPAPSAMGSAAFGATTAAAPGATTSPAPGVTASSTPGATPVGSLRRLPPRAASGDPTLLGAEGARRLAIRPGLREIGAAPAGGVRTDGAITCTAGEADRPRQLGTRRCRPIGVELAEAGALADSGIPIWSVIWSAWAHPGRLRNNEASGTGGARGLGVPWCASTADSGGQEGVGFTR